MKYLYLHIGRNKTGTTSLQKFLDVNENALREHGFKYKKYKKSVNFNKLFSELSYSELKSCTDEERSYKLEKAKNIISQTIDLDTHNIISSEALSNIEPKNLNYIFKGYSIILISYVRNELDYIASTYQQYIKANWTDLSFDNYLSKNRIINSLNESFIKKLYEINCLQLKVRKYSRESLYMNDIRHDFLKNVLQINEMDKFSLQNDSNLSISDEVIDFKIQLYKKQLDEYKNRKNITHFITLSNEFGAKFRIPKSKKEDLLNIIIKSKVEWHEEFGFGFSSNDYYNYAFSEERNTIDFKTMLDRFIKIIEKDCL